MIGERSFALTAGHVLSVPGETVFAMFVGSDDSWFGVKVLEHEVHPSEDIAAFRLDYAPLKSILCLNNAFETQSREYKQFAYPEDMMTEFESGGFASGRPDLIYLQGYIRRRTNHPIRAVRGTSLFELSVIGGAGCSGSPIFHIDGNRKWRVMGVYVAEKLNDRGTSVAFAVREDAFRDWTPMLVGRSLLAEAGA